MTRIDSGSVKEIRDVITRTLNDTLSKLGLRASMGRITYIPGQELRGKLTVSQKAAPKVFDLANPPARPEVRERWRFGGKVYTITKVDATSVLAERPSRARAARHTGYATYRIKLDALLNSGEKV